MDYITMECRKFGKKMYIRLLLPTTFPILTRCWLASDTPKIFVNIGSGSCLLPYGSKPLPEQKLTYHRF